jgi:hypothetical protein
MNIANMQSVRTEIVRDIFHPGTISSEMITIVAAINHNKRPSNPSFNYGE